MTLYYVIGLHTCRPVREVAKDDDETDVPSLSVYIQKTRDAGCWRLLMMHLSVADCMPTSWVSHAYEKSADGDRVGLRGAGQRQMHFESHTSSRDQLI